MTRIMRDSTAPSDIPVSGTDIAAGYVNGGYAWPASGWSRFNTVCRIDVNGSDIDADVLDVETGDASPAGAVVWIRAKRAAAAKGSYPPIIYCNQSSLGDVVSLASVAGFKLGTHYMVWIATLDGNKLHAGTGILAVQWRGAGPWGHYDESIVYENSWKAAVVPPQVQAHRLIDFGE